jgi:hypothetical protein
MRTVTIANREGSARRLGFAGLLALAGGGLASPALAADVPGGSGTKAVLQTGSAGVTGTFERRGDSDWYRLTLKGGQNYALRAPFFLDNLCAQLNLRDLNGKLLRSILGAAAMITASSSGRTRPKPSSSNSRTAHGQGPATRTSTAARLGLTPAATPRRRPP